jgi:hypothetical protein
MEILELNWNDKIQTPNPQWLKWQKGEKESHERSKEWTDDKPAEVIQMTNRERQTNRNQENKQIKPQKSVGLTRQT